MLLGEFSLPSVRKGDKLSSPALLNGEIRRLHCDRRNDHVRSGHEVEVYSMNASLFMKKNDLVFSIDDVVVDKLVYVAMLVSLSILQP